MPSATAATPGVYSHQTSSGQRIERTGCRVATGNSCRLAPIAVIASTPSVTRCSAASVQPRPPAKRGSVPLPASSATQASRWLAIAAPKKRSGIDAGNRRLVAPARKVPAASLTDLRAFTAVARSRCARQPKAHLARFAVDLLGAPAQLGEFGVE